MPLVQGKQIALATLRAGVSATPSKQNKGMTAETTAADHDEACATGIAVTPAASTNTNGAYVQVAVNGILYEVGDGVRTKACYFSGDAGATARAFGAIVATDKLFWNGSIAGFELAAATDKIDFFYLEAAA